MWRKIKWGGFCSEDEEGENRTSDRASIDEINPSFPPHPHWRQTHAKNTDIHKQKLNLGVQSLTTGGEFYLLLIKNKVLPFLRMWETLSRQMMGNHVFLTHDVNQFHQSIGTILHVYFMVRLQSDEVSSQNDPIVFTEKRTNLFWR